MFHPLTLKENMKTTIQALLIMMSIAFFGCKKSVTESTSTTDLSASQLKSATIAVNDVAVENATTTANYEADFYGGYERLLRDLSHVKGGKRDLLKGQGCMHYDKGLAPVVSIDTASAGYPITITVQYGASTLTQQRRQISGTVILVISGAKDTDGSTRTITYKDCKIDSIGINGTITETFNGNNTTTRKMTMNSDATFTLPDGTVINRIGFDVRDWIKGLDTPTTPEDDMIQITGTINVTSSTGDKYLRDITTPLIRLGDCNYPVQGIIQYSQNGAVIAEVNYGDGTCDNAATLTTNGATVNIVLKEGGHMPKAKTEGQHEGMPKGGMHHGMGN